MATKKKPYRHSPFDEEMYDAMTAFNKDKPSSKQFNLIDARLISLIHSYYYSDMVFFASNKWIAEKSRCTPASAQKSINKLLEYDLITKQVSCVEGKKQRVLTYNEPAAEKFKSDPGAAQPSWSEP